MIEQNNNLNSTQLREDEVDLKEIWRIAYSFRRSISILFLVVILNVAQAYLLPQGEVAITINDDVANEIKIHPGGTLLSALASQNIFLPSACGGGGTCAICLCQVFEGGGDISSN